MSHDWKVEMANLKTMKFEDLVIAKAKIEAEIEVRVAKERFQLIEAIRSTRPSSPSKKTSRSDRPHSLKGRKLPPRYRNPKNRNETWAGRGNRPRWLAAALKAGKKLEAFAIR